MEQRVVSVLTFAARLVGRTVLGSVPFPQAIEADSSSSDLLIPLGRSETGQGRTLEVEMRTTTNFTRFRWLGWSGRCCMALLRMNLGWRMDQLLLGAGFRCLKCRFTILEDLAPGLQEGDGWIVFWKLASLLGPFPGLAGGFIERRNHQVDNHVLRDASDLLSEKLQALDVVGDGG